MKKISLASYALGLFVYFCIGPKIYSSNGVDKCVESLKDGKVDTIHELERQKRAEKRILYFGQEQFNQMVDSVELLRGIPGFKMETRHPIYLELLKSYLDLFQMSGHDVTKFWGELKQRSDQLNYREFIRYILRIAHREKNESIRFQGGISLTGKYARELRLKPEAVDTDTSLEQAIESSQAELLYGDAETFPRFINFPIVTEGHSFGLALFNRALTEYGINPCVLTTNSLAVHGYNLRPSEVFLHDLAHGAILLVHRGRLINQLKFLSTDPIYEEDKYFLKQVEALSDPKTRVLLNLAFFLFQKEVVSYWDLTSDNKRSFDSFYEKMKDLSLVISKSNESINGVKARADFVNKYLWDLKARQNNESDGHRGVFATFFTDITKHGFLKNIVQDPKNRGDISLELFNLLFEIADGINGNGNLKQLFAKPN